MASDYRYMGKRSAAMAMATKTNKEIAQPLLDGRERKIAAVIDPQGVIRANDPQEYAKRRAAWLTAWALEMAQKRKAKQTAKANATILAVVQPKALCVYCLTERNQPMPEGATHQTCKTHATTMTAQRESYTRVRQGQLGREKARATV